MKSRLKKSCLIYLFFFLTSLSIAQNPIEKEGWILTFNDEFNDSVLDKTKWQDYYYWGGRQHEVSKTYYAPNQHIMTDSTLMLKAERKIVDSDTNYVSGLVDGNKSFKQKYGYFEIRSKNPTGTGFWPAFWLVTTESWPPEIDIFEFYTNQPDILHTTQHWLNKSGKKKMQPKNHKIDDASADFHTYAIEWTPKKIIWYYDNKKIRSSRRGVKKMIYPMHIIINNEVSDFKEMDLSNATFPNYFEIDYVRVYQKKSED